MFIMTKGEGGEEFLCIRKFHIYPKNQFLVYGGGGGLLKNIERQLLSSHTSYYTSILQVVDKNWEKGKLEPKLLYKRAAS